MDPRVKFRRMVSLKKKRFVDGDFDLDLAYITERIIAFGFPSEGREAVFRNPMGECQRFFETRHKDHYYVYNLCIEKDRQYKEKKFHNRVGKYQWHDHNAPPLELIPQFCEHAGNWLDEDPENVVAVHCKAGKGRTGVLITCLLLYLRMFDDADEAMEFYGKQRTHNGKGVTIPSQKRFIRYYCDTLKTGMPARMPVAFLKQVQIDHLPQLPDTDFSVGVECNMVALHFKAKGDAGYESSKDDTSLLLTFNAFPLNGSTKVTIYKPGKKREPLCWYWFHCAFVGKQMRLEKAEIDKAVGDREHEVFPATFAITTIFDTSTLEEVEAADRKEAKKGGKKEAAKKEAAKKKKKKHSKRKEKKKEAADDEAAGDEADAEEATRAAPAQASGDEEEEKSEKEEKSEEEEKSEKEEAEEKKADKKTEEEEDDEVDDDEEEEEKKEEKDKKKEDKKEKKKDDEKEDEKEEKKDKKDKKGEKKKEEKEEKKEEKKEEGDDEEEEEDTKEEEEKKEKKEKKGKKEEKKKEKKKEKKEEKEEDDEEEEEKEEKKKKAKKGGEKKKRRKKKDGE